jgi:hypothetical protein
MTEHIRGPGPDYTPRTGDRQLPPEAYESAAERGRALVMKVLADCGIRKRVDGKWTVEEPTEENRDDD